MAQYFGFEGRVRPMTFWVNAILLAIINVIVSFLFVDVYLSWGTGGYQVHISNPPMYYLITFALLWRFTSIAVRRFQDQEKEKEWAALLVPGFLLALFPAWQYTAIGPFVVLVAAVCGFIAVGFLGFHPGDQGVNTFGEAPEDGQLF